MSKRAKAKIKPRPKLYQLPETEADKRAQALRLEILGFRQAQGSDLKGRPPKK